MTICTIFILKNCPQILSSRMTANHPHRTTEPKTLRLPSHQTSKPSMAIKSWPYQQVSTLKQVSTLTLVTPGHPSLGCVGGGELGGWAGMGQMLRAEGAELEPGAGARRKGGRGRGMSEEAARPRKGAIPGRHPAPRGAPPRPARSEADRGGPASVAVRRGAADLGPCARDSPAAARRRGRRIM